MTSVVNVDPRTKSVELVLPHGCFVCGSEVHMRMSPNEARTFCAVCHLVARPTVVWASSGMTLDYRHIATA